MFAQSDLSTLAALAEASPAMLWRGDANGRCVYLNAAMRAFWGLAEGQPFDWSTSLIEDDHQLVFLPFSEGMSRQRPFQCEGRYRRWDGAIRILRTKAEPIFLDDGSFGGMIGVNEDLTDLRQTEREIEQTNKALAEALSEHQRLNERLQLATRISGLAMSEHDADLRYTWAHNLPPDVIGLTPAELVGGGEVGKSLHEILSNTLASGAPQSQELPLVINGVSRWFDIQAARIVHSDGRQGVVASALDVTARKLNEQKLEVLARELAHRVKNVFAVVQALVRQSARAKSIPDEFLASVESRLQSLALAQDELISAQDNQVALQPFIEKQLQHVTGVVVQGPEVALPGAIAPYLALAIHELSTNSLKYGALATAKGRVEVGWRARGASLLEFWWIEEGCCRATTREKGFGTALLTRIFSSATGGQATLEPSESGLRWNATFSIKPIVMLGTTQ